MCMVSSGRQSDAAQGVRASADAPRGGKIKRFRGGRELKNGRKLVCKGAGEEMLVAGNPGPCWESRRKLQVAQTI